jgi:hypothetical protein
MEILQELIKATNSSKEPLSLYSDPFTQDNIESVIFFINKTYTLPVHAQITFKVNNTEGKHTIKGTNFGLIVKQTEEFIKSLPDGK